MTRALACAAALAAVAARPMPAAADEATAAGLAAARAERDALRYPEALARVEAALARGGATTSQTAALYRLAGELTAGLDRPDEAERWFARWLALEPRGALPADASPKLREPLARARASSSGRPITLRADVAHGGVDVVDDPLHLVARVVTFAGGAPEYEPAPPAGAERATLAVAFDARGNQLAGLALVPPASARPHDPPFLRRWQPYAVVTGAFLAAAAATGYGTMRSQDEFDRLRAEGPAHSFDELEAVRRDGERGAVVTNVLLGGAAVSAVVTVVMWRWQPRPPARPAITLAPAATPGGAAMTFTARF